jgi:hypothetical protein
MSNVSEMTREQLESRVEELEHYEREESEAMARAGVNYDCTFVDGWMRVVDERDELREVLKKLYDEFERVAPSGPYDVIGEVRAVLGINLRTAAEQITAPDAETAPRR